MQLPGGGATRAPPVGTALGPHGVNIMDFCKQYNAATEPQRGNVIPVEITIYEDRSFTFITKTPPAPELIKKAAGVDKGSKEPHKTKVGSLTAAQLRQIAETTMPDLNATTTEAGTTLPSFTGNGYSGPTAKCLSCHDGSQAVGDFNLFDETGEAVGLPRNATYHILPPSLANIGYRGPLTGNPTRADPHPRVRAV